MIAFEVHSSDLLSMKGEPYARLENDRCCCFLCPASAGQRLCRRRWTDQPRLSYADPSGTQTVDLVPTTNGSGNVKGIQCTSSDWGYSPTLTVKITVNGGTVQNLTVDFNYLPGYNTGFIPMNVRFSSSIRIQVQGGYTWSGHSGTCVASWALD